MPLTNREIIGKADILFAHTSDFNLPGAFANRHESRKVLADRLQMRDRPSLTVVSDLLGSGKTYLVEMVIASHGLNDAKLQLCGKNKPEAMAKAAKVGPVFVDEWDIKASPRNFDMAIQFLETFFRTHSHPVVLMGDYTLQSPLMEARLKGIADVSRVPMEPLSPAFFGEAMRQRIWYAFMDRYGPRSQADDVPNEDIGIFDARLLAALVPAWTKTSATLREIFSTLSQIASTLKANDETAQIGQNEVTAWLAAKPLGGLSDLQLALIREAISTLAPAMAAGNDVVPWSQSDLRNMLGGAAATMTDTAFAAEVVEPLARNGLLSALGIPHLEDDGAYYRWPEPFLPGVRLRLQAAFTGA